MQLETPSLFADVIQDHLELKRRNAELDGNLPLDRYKSEDPFDNHPLFKTEEQARIEETMDGEDALPTTEVVSHVAETEAAVDDSLWGRSRDFDWGD
jgi:hypothetical protein